MTTFKATIFIILLLVSDLASGQKKHIGLTLQLSNPVRDVQAGWFDIDNESFDGFNVKNKSFATGLTILYYLNDKTQLRLRTGLTKINITEYGGFTIGTEYDTLSVNGKQTKIHIAPGIIWCNSNERFNFFGGFEIPYTMQQKYALASWSKITDINSDSLILEEIGTQTIPKGFSIGIGAIIGFNFSIVNWFSIGAEFSPSIFYYSLGGETVSLITSDPNWSYYTRDKNEGFTGYENRFTINMTFNLLNKK